MRKRWCVAGVCWLCLSSSHEVAAFGYFLADWERLLEQQRHARLAVIQADQGNHLAVFTTDGCSGGMSQGWQVVAEIIPEFAARWGRAPPWKHCCLAHDRAYWRGETKNGFRMRLAADLDLRACVLATAGQQQVKLATKTAREQAELQQWFAVAAELMYRAVRAGGQPCSLFPWRWGYGWPKC